MKSIKKFRKLVCLVFLTALMSANTTTAQEPPMMSVANAHQFSFKTIQEETLELSELKGKVLLVVNTASKCGFTPQYRELESLYNTYKEKGLVVIGVPSPDFGGQEFEEETKVQDFTEKNFSISFPLTQINHVKGDKAHPFYKWSNNKAGFIGAPRWNFHKYLIDKNGTYVTWFGSTTSPLSAKVIKAIEKELKK